LPADHGVGSLHNRQRLLKLYKVASGMSSR
jgi:hypothetical protein